MYDTGLLCADVLRSLNLVQLTDYLQTPFWPKSTKVLYKCRSMIFTNVHYIRDGKEPQSNKNEPNQNPGFAKNRTDIEPESKICARTEPELKMSWFLLGSFTEWNCR